MKKSLLIIVVLMPPLLMGMAYYKHTHPSYVFRYRLTIEVDTPQGVRSGSSVLEQHAGLTSPFPNPGPVAWSETYGDAVFVDLGGGRNVVAILGHGPFGTDDRFDELAADAFRLRGGVTYWGNILEKKTGSAELTPEYIPTLISFSDINDPRTARVVTPEQFELVIGSGVRFKRAWIETTHDPVSRDIQARLPWLTGDGRPAVVAWQAWLRGESSGASVAPEDMFRRR